MNGFTGKVEILDDHVPPTDEECTREHQNNYFAMIKLFEGYNTCTLDEQKRIRETENNVHFQCQILGFSPCFC